MKKVKSIVFLSNYFNHHQSALSDELYRILGDGYKFIATQPMEQERIKLGWDQCDKEYIVFSYKNQSEHQRSLDLINSADVVIFGSAPAEMIRKRIKGGKLTFRYTERIFKKGLELHKFPVRFIRFHFNNGPNVYLLCASAYTSSDYSKFGLFKNRAYKWGYFPEDKSYDDIDKLIDSKKKSQILWCGRFLDLKHVDDAIKAVCRLSDEGYDCSLNIIGSGEREEYLKNLAVTLDKNNCIQFLGSMSPDDVRSNMEQHGIFLLTSDFQEGWGAVLNEAMNSGCAVVASHAAGSVPFLIKDGSNGLIYKSGDINDLYSKIKYLLENPKEQKKIALNAYNTITLRWSPKIAAERLLTLSEALLNNKNAEFEDGPCSKATLLSNRWYKGRTR